MTPAWKSDFPVAWADDRKSTRRQFAKCVAGATCAALVAGGALPGPGPSQPVRLERADDLPVGGSRVFRFADAPCLLIRLEADRFVAFSQRCTHLGCPVIYRPDARDLQCPCHEGYFSAEDGSVRSGPPPRPLPRVRLERKGSELWATAMENG